MPIITIIAPVILLIHSIVLILKFLRNRLSIHDMLNQYITEPALTERMIGVTLQLCGASFASPKKAKSVNITNIAIGFDSPMATACPKSFGETEESPSSFIFLKGSEKAIVKPTMANTIPPTRRMAF